MTGGWTVHLMVVPILLPLVVGAVLLFVNERRRRLKAAFGAASSVALLLVALELLRFADMPTEAGGVATGVYLLGNWPAPFGIVLVVDRLSALMLLLAAVPTLAACVPAPTGRSPSPPVSPPASVAIASPSAVASGPSPSPTFTRPTPTPLPTFLLYTVRDGDTLTAIGTLCRRPASHSRSWRHAAWIAHSPRLTMSPDSSAKGTNSAGGTSPRWGCRQRSKASAPESSLLSTRIFG